MSAGPDLSIVVPFYNEEQNIERMYHALVTALEPIQRTFELVFVDDGSRDRTATIATEVARQDSRVRLVKFRRNYGQTPAMAAGIQCSRGRVIITMDGDLQNDPTDIGLFLATMETGYDIVVGWRHNRQDKLVSRKIPSKIANWLIGKVTGVPIRDNGCSLKAYRADLIKHIPLYSEMHRFIPAMASIAGPRIAEIKVKHHARQFGKSKYGISRTYKVLLDLMVIKTITRFTSRPLLWFSLLSLPLVVFGMVALLSGLFTGSVGHMISLPLTGSGLVLLAAAANMMGAGAFGELVYKLGDVRERDFSRLTQEVHSASSVRDRGLSQ
jgi:glycosyltransferase involved in cell wall biosynthesis